MKPLTPNKARRLAILERAWAGYCSCNVRYAFALTDEPQMKWLVRKGYIVFERSGSLRWSGKTVTMARITEDGVKYLEKEKQ